MCSVSNGRYIHPNCSHETWTVYVFNHVVVSAAAVVAVPVAAAGAVAVK